MLASDQRSLSSSSPSAISQTSLGPGPPDARALAEKWTLYERIVYTLGILVPNDVPSSDNLEPGQRLQAVKLGDKWRWRVVKDINYGLPEQLTSWKKVETKYIVLKTNPKAVPVLDGSSPFLKMWDVITLCLLLFTATVTPYEIAFLHSSTVDLLFVIGIGIDAVFFCDSCIQFFCAYQESDTNRIIRDHPKIILHYLTGWFLLDMVSSIPFELFQFFLSAASTANTLELLRFLRLLRLLKLLRILRANRKLKQLQSKLSISQSQLVVAKVMIIVLISMHWLACSFMLAGSQLNPSDPGGWPTKLNLTLPLYAISLRWACAVLFHLAAPPYLIMTTTRELIMECLGSAFAFIVNVFVIANIAAVYGFADKDSWDIRNLMDRYMEMAKRLSLPGNQKVSINKYWIDQQELASIDNFSSLLNQLPPGLQSNIGLGLYTKLLEQVPYVQPFLKLEPDFIRDLCKEIQIKAYPANTIIFSNGIDGLYFVRNGLLAVGGRLLRSGHIVGRTCLREVPRKVSGLTLTATTVYHIPKQILQELMEKTDIRILRYAQRWTAWEVFREYLISYSKLYYRYARREGFGPSLRGRMRDDELDNVDHAVLDHIAKHGI